MSGSNQESDDDDDDNSRQPLPNSPLKRMRDKRDDMPDRVHPPSNYYGACSGCEDPPCLYNPRIHDEYLDSNNFIQPFVIGPLSNLGVNTINLDIDMVLGIGSLDMLNLILTSMTVTNVGGWTEPKKGYFSNKACVSKYPYEP